MNERPAQRPREARPSATAPAGRPISARRAVTRVGVATAALLLGLGAVLAASTFLLPAAAAAADAWALRKLSSSTINNRHPRIDGEDRYVVHEGKVAGESDSEIVLQDLVVGGRTILTRNDANEILPMIDGESVVWQMSEGSDPPEICLYDITSGHTTVLTDNTTFDGGPRLAGDLVVWLGRPEPSLTGEIFVYRISTGVTTQLTIDEAEDGGPETDGELVVWHGRPVGEDDGGGALLPGRDEIYLYDGHTVLRLTDNESDDRNPRVSGGVVTWQGGEGGDLEIYVAYDAGFERLTDNDVDDVTPCVYSDDSGTWVAWLSGDAPQEREVWLAHAKPGGSTFSAVRLTDDDLEDGNLSAGPGGLVWSKVDGSDDVIAVLHSTFEGAVTQVVGETAANDNPAVGGSRVACAVESAGGGQDVYLATKDTTAPTGVVTSPADGTIVSDPQVTIRGTAHDDLAVERVEVDAGDHVWRPAVIESGAGTASATWSLEWMVPPEDDVTHTLKVRVTDGAGNQGPSTGNPTVRVQTGAAFSFVDVPADHPYRDAILAMRQAHIAEGYELGAGQWAFRPENRLWRAQFAKMAAVALKLRVEEGMTSPFSDLGANPPDNLYPHEYVAAVYEQGITTGTSAVTFTPYADVTRAQVVTMLVRAIQALHPEYLATPPIAYAGTLGMFDPVHGPTLKLAEYNDLLEGLVGFGPGWDPWAPATRGETAQLIWNLL